MKFRNLNEAKKILSRGAYEQCEREYLRKTHNYPAGPVTDIKPRPRHEPVAAISAPIFNQKVSIRCHSVRHRLADEENLYAKSIIDALRYSGVLEDDSPRYVTGPFHTQEIGYPEETIITIEPIEGMKK